MSVNINSIFESDPRIVEVRVYEDGFVPLSYKWPAPGKCRVYKKEEESIKEYSYQYDRKRSNGRGPHWVAFSGKNGRLQSG